MFPTIHGIVSQAQGDGGGGGASKTGWVNEGTLSNTDLGNAQVGWEFKVGATPITVTHGRLKITSAVDAITLQLWRVSDGALLAQTVAFSTAALTWIEQAFPSPIALAANTNYVISVYRGGINIGGTQSNTNVSGTATLASEITFVSGRHEFGGFGFPTGTTANTSRGLTDIVFTV